MNLYARNLISKRNLEIYEYALYIYRIYYNKQ